MVKTYKTGKIVNFLLTDEYIEKMNEIAKEEYTDRTKLLRKWIDRNYKLI